MFAYSSAIEDDADDVLDVSVGDSLVCCALIVELIVPIQYNHVVVTGTRPACILSV